MRRFIVVLLGLLAFVTGAVNAPAETYSITDLGTLGGWSMAFGINDSGQIVGQMPRVWQISLARNIGGVYNLG